eukprot:TRINITY_DN40891_c0_g1_i1.p2 TRINITY_DN40891_c0_g1~~TRINITY_DN40891_c0_g1_i1.p2  ORF type:complete len:107 (-),score=16.53 TRINITY_DN40891_c0_g1_i1:305-592(-)
MESSDTNEGSLLKKLEDQWQRTVKHAQTYPYVWASYGVVYGTLGILLTYKWRNLRKHEERVRALQLKLKQMHEAKEAAAKAQAQASSQGTDQPLK